MANLFGRLFLPEMRLRLEEAVRSKFLNVEAVRIYLPEIETEINQTTERGARAFCHV